MSLCSEETLLTVRLLLGDLREYSPKYLTSSECGYRRKCSKYSLKTMPRKSQYYTIMVYIYYKYYFNCLNYMDKHRNIVQIITITKLDLPEHIYKYVDIIELFCLEKVSLIVTENMCSFKCKIQLLLLNKYL